MCLIWTGIIIVFGCAYRYVQLRVKYIVCRVCVCVCVCVYACGRAGALSLFRGRVVLL